MRITAATLTPLHLTLAQPLKTARGTYAARDGFLVRLTDEDGHVGQGEAMPLPEFGTESLATTHRVLREWLDGLQGQSLEDSIEGIEATLVPSASEELRQRGARIRGLDAAEAVPAAQHGLELALLDLLAQRKGVPLCWLLAEEARPEVLVNALLGSEEPEALAQEARAAVAEGFQTLKVKVAGRPLDADEARVRAVRDAVGPGVRIRLDANGGWTEPEANRALDRLGWYDLELVEQPTPPEDLQALWRVQRRAPCLLAADETLATPAAVRALLTMDLGGGPVVGAVVLKPMVLGGLLPSMVVALRAARMGMHAYVTSSIDGVVARAGAAHLASALPSGELASGLAVGRLFADEPRDHPYQPRKGLLRLRDAPGLGLPVDPAGAP
ncbi:o-succinylbenzoate synthase [Corallococcus silvisoli]|uniref:o-succinylbenzoate synthase n=1 Tax=Corallococcus silvisoli TaxID=2697031 RepID=UPI001378B124|nr:o-succinylbenzoate synthase [Corallococcus silvisoli]NBD09182.1 o-succinylbenzoate synthase [Corallococcus silvisoli]